MIKLLFRIYQILILLPVVVIITIFVGIMIMLVSPLLPESRRVAYNSFMGKVWGKTIVLLATASDG